MKKVALILSSLFLLLTGCAIMGQIDGGETDNKPPRVLGETPKTKSLNFKASEIKIDFDEYITISNQNLELTFSPEIIPLPIIEAKGKSIIVKIDPKSLKGGVTYTINFGRAIMDVNEGNIYEDYNYVFSTGSIIDSLQTSGNCVDAYTGAVVKGAKIILVDKEDSKIKYVARSNEVGQFKMANLPKRAFNLSGFVDKNLNSNLDKDESKAYLSNSIVPNSGSLMLRFYRSVPDSLRLLNYTLNGYRLVFKTNIAIDSFKTDWQIITEKTESLNNDSFSINFSKKQLRSKLTLYLAGVRIDSILDINAKYFKSDSGLLTTIESNYANENNNGSPVLIHFNQPVTGIDNRRILLYADSILTPVKLDYADESKLNLVINHKFKSDRKYMIKIDSGAFKSWYGNYNSGLKGEIKVPNQVDYATLSINVITEKHVIFELVNEDNSIEFTKGFTGNNLIILPKVKPGIYSLKLINDANNNGVWDSGNQKNGIQPEEVVFYPEKINVKANWELEGITFKY